MTQHNIAPLIDQLKPAFGDRLQTGTAIREQHGHTTTWLTNQPPEAVIFPSSTQEVSDIVRACADHNVPIIPFGTGSSLEGHVNAPKGGMCIDLSRMDKVLAVHAEDFDVTLQPGATRKALNEELRASGLFFPIDPGADASLGGMAATRASGTNAVRYGTMRDAVLALEVVLADGRIIRTGTRAKKSSAGLDLTRMFIGSEGTLGVITELTLKLQGIPAATSSARCAFPDIESACNAVIATIQYGIPVARIELLDALQVKAVNDYSGLDLPLSPLLLLEFHGSDAGVAEQAEQFGEIAEEFGSTLFDWTTNPEERSKLWQARHDAYWATLRLRPGARGISTDVCVPISRLADCVTAAQEEAARLNLVAPIIGHVGDGNFHVLLLVDDSDATELANAEQFVGWLNDTAIAMDGTCTGEHGIGQGKRPYLRRELGEAVDVMGDVKMALDPQGLMNPGKIYSER